jgi:hypothetical protein
MVDFIFETEDYGGTQVVLAVYVWEDKILSPSPIGHPEVAPYLNTIRQAIIEPDVVFQSTRREDTKVFYRLRAGTGQFEGLHLVIIVKYLLESSGWRGYISTAYLTHKLYSKGKILWTSNKSLNP